MAIVRIPAALVGKYIKKNLIYAHWGRGLNNFGDCLSPDILRHYGLTPVYVTNNAKSDIILAGSILQWTDAAYSGIILGTGGDKMDYMFPNARVLAVRGRLTRKNFRHGKVMKLGDPGLLMQYVYPDEEEKKYKLGIIPHFVDANEPFLAKWKNAFGSDVIFIDVLQSPSKVIRQIKQCRAIASSSLHGLIIADAYHIPNIRFVNRRTMPTSFYDYKFEDYYSSFNFEESPIEVDGTEAVQDIIDRTTLKPVEPIERLKRDLDNLMLTVSQEFRHTIDN